MNVTFSIRNIYRNVPNLMKQYLFHSLFISVLVNIASASIISEHTLQNTISIPE